MRKKRRNKNNLTARQQSKINNINSIKELLLQNKKQKEIAEILQIDKSVVSRYVKEIKLSNLVVNKNLA